MDRRIAMALYLAGALSAAPLVADPPADVMTIVREQDIKWSADPTIPGLQTASSPGIPRSRASPTSSASVSRPAR